MKDFYTFLDLVSTLDEDSIVILNNAFAKANDDCILYNMCELVDVMGNCSLTDFLNQIDTEDFDLKHAYFVKWWNGYHSTDNPYDLLDHYTIETMAHWAYDNKVTCDIDDLKAFFENEVIT